MIKMNKMSCFFMILDHLGQLTNYNSNQIAQGLMMESSLIIKQLIVFSFAHPSLDVFSPNFQLFNSLNIFACLLLHDTSLPLQLLNQQIPLLETQAKFVYLGLIPFLLHEFNRDDLFLLYSLTPNIDNSYNSLLDYQPLEIINNSIIDFNWIFEKHQGRPFLHELVIDELNVLLICCRVLHLYVELLFFRKKLKSKAELSILSLKIGASFHYCPLLLYILRQDQRQQDKDLTLLTISPTSYMPFAVLLDM